MKKELGKYFLDISKLTFGGIVIASIMQNDINNILLIIAGLVVVVLSAITGLYFIINEKGGSK